MFDTVGLAEKVREPKTNIWQSGTFQGFILTANKAFLVPTLGRAAIDFDAALGGEHNPVFFDAGLGVEGGIGAVQRHTRHGDFNYQFSGMRMDFEEILLGSTYDCDVGLC